MSGDRLKFVLRHKGPVASVTQRHGMDRKTGRFLVTKAMTTRQPVMHTFDAQLRLVEGMYSEREHLILVPGIDALCWKTVLETWSAPRRNDSRWR